MASCFFLCNSSSFCRAASFNFWLMAFASFSIYSFFKSASASSCNALSRNSFSFYSFSNLSLSSISRCCSSLFLRISMWAFSRLLASNFSSLSASILAASSSCFDSWIYSCRFLSSSSAMSFLISASLCASLCASASAWSWNYWYDCLSSLFFCSLPAVFKFLTSLASAFWSSYYWRFWMTALYLSISFLASAFTSLLTCSIISRIASSC